jgi:hypothetical protein
MKANLTDLDVFVSVAGRFRDGARVASGASGLSEPVRSQQA